MRSPDPEPQGEPERAHWLLDRLLPKRTRFERSKRRSLASFFALALVVGGVDVWVAALSRIDAFEVTSESLRLIVDASPASEPCFGIAVLAIAAIFFAVKTYLNLLADRVQGAATRR